MRILPYVFLLLMGMTWRCVKSTCVFETDFGLSINCALKKSGLFRVRNLGGLKGYVGLGIQLADELGFKESLSTLEQNSKRRSVNGFPVPGSFEPLQSLPQKNNQATTATENNDNQDRSAYAKMNGRTAVGVVTVPPFRPLMAAANNMVRNVRLAAQQQQQQQYQQQQQKQQQKQQQQQLLKPLPVPAFAALPESIAKVAVEPAQPSSFASGHRQLPTASVVTPMAFGQSPQNSVDVRPIIVMPSIPTADDRKKQTDSNSPLSNEVDPASMMSLFNVAAANNVSVEQLAMALRQRQQQQTFYQTVTDNITTPTPTTTVSALPTTTTTPQPPPALTSAYFSDEQQPVAKKIAIKPYKSKYSGSHKVMNAPKEYYPVGYDKNFDDNFVSKVDLPDTTFSCGDQKHFPGLYGDEDLGCMVFHVCAFTDDGLTQKSFLCPESTLFDQTILKCNWWFYVDCKSSKKLYDSNIPISKSYQLMKALTFFSSYSAGPSMDASVAAATAAVSQHSSDESNKSDLATISSQFDGVTSSSVSNTTTSAEVLDNVSLRR
ncbi:PREDICTED: uncharacterized protein C146.01 [Diuraphis noxia]|uniref:uncharacterized protein C146.01 n=1 Tax=Diuraphis noxia TaxID=143948 RepID=UPI0007639188|nr:PREDICTED: uncharacterized protein C146.01 [Diuraphis noxia]